MSPRAVTLRKASRHGEPCPRRALASAAEAGGYSLAELSRMLGRWDGYLQRFVAQGCPLALSPADHQQLADFFGVEERGLGIRLLWAPIAA